MAQILSHKDLIVWQKSMDLVLEIYELTKKFPRAEFYNLISQMRRCVVSIALNIAEGRRWLSQLDFKRFFIIAYGSAVELETQIEIAQRLKYISLIESQKSIDLLEEIMKMLNKMISSLSQQPST